MPPAARAKLLQIQSYVQYGALAYCTAYGAAEHVSRGECVLSAEVCGVLELELNVRTSVRLRHPPSKHQAGRALRAPCDWLINLREFGASSSALATLEITPFSASRCTIACRDLCSTLTYGDMLFYLFDGLSRLRLVSRHVFSSAAARSNSSRSSAVKSLSALEMRTKPINITKARTPHANSNQNTFL